MKAVILAAGKGTRFKSDKPKVLHEILGKPMVWYVINSVRQGGIEDVAVVVGHEAEKVKKAIKEEVVFFHQENPKGGTADAVLASIDFWRNHDDYLLIVNGDSPLVTSETIRNMQRFIAMVEEYEKIKLGGAILTSVVSDPTGYGRIVKEEGTDRILKIVEENADRLAKLDKSFSQIAEDMVGFQVEAIDALYKRGIEVPIHPGLAKYLKEKGVWKDEWKIAGED